MAEVKVTVRSEDQGSANIRKFGESLAGIAGKAIATGIAMGTLKYAMDSVSDVIRGTWNVLNEGAALELAQSRFENLAASIGTTADALKNQMGAATSGMVSQAQLVASASDMISLGLADSGDEVVRLSNLVGQLGWDMNVLTLTMANDSMLRLDALGLSMENVKAKMEALKATGMAAGDAFDLAVIEAGEEKLALLGSAADTTAGHIQQLTVMWQDAVAAFKTEFASSVGDQLDEIVNLINQGGPDLVEGMGYWGKLAGDTVGNLIAGAASEGMQRMTDDLKDQLAAMGVARQELADLERQATDRPLPIIYDAQEGIKYYSDLNKALKERYGLLLDLQNLNQRDDRDAAEMAANFEAQREAAIEAVLALYVYDDALEKVAETENGVVEAASNVGHKIQAMAGLADVAAAAMARGADKAGVMAGALRQLEDVASANKLADAAAAAEALADSYEAAAASMSAAFNAALEKGGALDFGNLDKMAAAAWGVAQAFGLTVPQLGDIGIALGEITPDMAEAAAKAAIFQQAFGNLLGQFQAGNLDTSGFITAYDALISDLQSKSLIEIQVEMKQVANPARDLWAWLPKEERTVEVPAKITLEQSALTQAIDVLDGIPDNNQKIVTFEAEYTEVTTAVTTIEADIAAIDATVLMTPETAAVDAAIERIDESRLTVYVDYVAGEPPVPPGRAVGGPVAGGSPYIVGEHGPELFVPWTGGTVVPNGRFSSTGDGGGISMVVNFYGPTSGADVAHAVDSAGRRLLQKVRQAGVPV